MKLRQVEHEQRKKARVDRLHENQHTEILLDPQSRQDRENIKIKRQLTETTIALLKNDKISQKESI